MPHFITAAQPGEIDLNPATREAEILQNIATLLATPQFSVPLDRGLGLGQRFLDLPMQASRAVLVSEVLDAVERYEPRAEVVSVTIEAGDRPGAYIPTVEVKILDE